MKYCIGIRREDLSKKGEMRVAIVPQLLEKIIQAGYRSIVQPGIHPKTGENKRQFKDAVYISAGAELNESLEEAELIFGLKEIDLAHIAEGKTYFMFSHTHKGQVKNRKLLQALSQKQCTLIDYELITDANKQRILTAFTYYAGYAGMADSLWTLAERQPIFPSGTLLKQSAAYENMAELYQKLDLLASQIAKEGTSPHLPPLICAFLGNGKTSTGAQQIYDRLPVKEISREQLEETYRTGSRKFVYKLVLDIPDMYKLKEAEKSSYSKLGFQELFNLYIQEPHRFESDMEGIFPYCAMWMNCIIWSDAYPRLISRSQAKSWFAQHQTLQVIGDITCDPEGAIQFSQETWIDEPVFIYHPATDQSRLGFEGEGIAVMAVTNLPCEFPADASTQFSQDFEPLIAPMLQADFHAEDFTQAGLPPEFAGACILWKGSLTENYNYMHAYL